MPCAEEGFIDSHDQDLVCKVTERSLSKKSSNKSNDRPDVIIKTVFRIFRQFYKRKLDEVLGKRRKGKPRPEIIASLDKLTDNLIKQRALRIFDSSITPMSLSEYLGALIMPKVIQQTLPKQSKKTKKSKDLFKISGSGAAACESISSSSCSSVADFSKMVSGTSREPAVREQKIARIHQIHSEIHKVLY